MKKYLLNLLIVGFCLLIVTSELDAQSVQKLTWA